MVLQVICFKYQKIEIFSILSLLHNQIIKMDFFPVFCIGIKAVITWTQVLHTLEKKRQAHHTND